VTRAPEFDLMLPSQVAAIWKINAKSVIRWVKAGRIRSVKTAGGHHRIPVSAVRASLIDGGFTAAEADLRIAAILGRQAGGS
jgi:excisionase family DNA binding protein